MLRHIMSVSLAMTACATLIPTKVNAATLSIQPSYTRSIPKNTGDILEFIFYLDPGPSSSVILDSLTVTPDMSEFSKWDPVLKFTKNSLVDKKSVIATFKAVIGTPVKDGKPDVDATVSYWDSSFAQPLNAGDSGADVVPVPEPLTILGAATALGYGVIFKRKSSKNTVS